MTREGYYAYTRHDRGEPETYDRGCGCSGYIERSMGGTERVNTHLCPSHREERVRQSELRDRQGEFLKTIGGNDRWSTLRLHKDGTAEIHTLEATPYAVSLSPAEISMVNSSGLWPKLKDEPSEEVKAYCQEIRNARAECEAEIKAAENLRERSLESCNQVYVQAFSKAETAEYAAIAIAKNEYATAEHEAYQRYRAGKATAKFGGKRIATRKHRDALRKARLESHKEWIKLKDSYAKMPEVIRAKEDYAKAVEQARTKEQAKILTARTKADSEKGLDIVRCNGCGECKGMPEAYKCTARNCSCSVH